MTFQRQRVRSSTSFYTRFNLAMVRSPRLRVYSVQLSRAFNARFHYGSAPEGLNLRCTE